MKYNAAEKKIVKVIMRQLDAIQRKQGSFLARRAINRWLTGQRERSKLTKERALLEKKLAEVSQRLS
jgi:hypothetical protein